MVIVDGVLFFNSFFIILKQYFPDDAEFLRAQASLSILPVSIDKKVKKANKNLFRYVLPKECFSQSVSRTCE